MRRVRLSDRLVDDLAAEIISGERPAGTMLPTEPQLAVRFGVSRTVVREAIARLERNGLVRVRQGSGTVVRPHADWHDLDPDLLRVRARLGLIGDLATDLLAIRRMVEVEVAGQAAARRTPADVALLEEYLVRMADSIADPVAYNDADIAFHEALIAAAGNDLLRKLMHPVNEVRRIGSEITSRAPDVVHGSLAGHRAICDAVRAGDADRARAAMASHIGQFERDLAEMLMDGRVPAERSA